MFEQNDNFLAQELLEAISFFNQKGWSPATSTNYSVRSSVSSNILISRSGVDKSKFRLEDLILINPEGRILPPFDKMGVKSSAETEIHTFLYEKIPDVRCVLHTHSVLGTTLSLTMEREGQILFGGLEILKGLEGNSTHVMEEVLPIVPNSQDMGDIRRNMETQFNRHPNLHGFLIAGHGLYTWGKSISAAKRHVETFEFLFECLNTMRR